MSICHADVVVKTVPRVSRSRMNLSLADANLPDGSDAGSRRQALVDVAAAAAAAAGLAISRRTDGCGGPMMNESHGR